MYKSIIMISTGFAAPTIQKCSDHNVVCKKKSIPSIGLVDCLDVERSVKRISTATNKQHVNQ